MASPNGPLGISRPALTARRFSDPDRAERLLGDPALAGLSPTELDAVVTELVGAAGPDGALLCLVRLAESAPDRATFLSVLGADAAFRHRLIAVLGASPALGEHLVTHPGDWELLRTGRFDTSVPTADEFAAKLLAAVGAKTGSADGSAAEPVAADATPQTVEALRTAYRRVLLTLAACDLTGRVDVESIAAGLADLAAATLRAALAVARAGRGTAGVPCRLAVVAMGKCGGRELNYVSDVDVIFVAEPAEPAQTAEPAQLAEPAVDVDAALRSATELASAMMTICADVAWPVDAGLRPEGKNGPLVRTLDSYESYYRRWARTWEFQALLKARPVAGDLALGRAYLDRVSPLIWTAAERDGFVTDVQAMRRRVEESLPPAVADRELKLGRGGLRDVEFAVQLLQLVHGRADEALRSGSTLDGLGALADGGYVGREDAATLAGAYRFLRTAEHRLQLEHLRRTHLLPIDDAGIRRLARAMGLRPDPRRSVVEVFTAEHGRHKREIRRLHEKLFYRPLLAAAAKVPTESLSLSPAAARARLTALGFTDPSGALHHIAALTDGVSRRAAIQRTLLPALLGQLADAPDPDGGLRAYRTVSAALAESPWYLRLLRDEGVVAERLVHLLGRSKYVVDLLARVPESLRLLADDAELAPRPADSLGAAMLAAVDRHDDMRQAIAMLRSIRRHELLRIAAADLLDRLTIDDVGGALTAVADATTAAALVASTRAVAAEHGGEIPVRLAVIAMGRLGGCEVGYGSDADVQYVYRADEGVPDETAARLAGAIIDRMQLELASPAPDPPLELDAGLRPEGRNGPLVRSFASYAGYYRRWSQAWESQALLRARPIAGDEELGADFVELIWPLRYPDGLADRDIVEIRRIKARVDAERLPFGTDPKLHTKLGRGGLADVEWTVQLLQLRYAGDLPQLRTPRTVEALRAAAGAGLLERDDAAALEGAWQLAMRVRNAITLVRGRAGDQIPPHGVELTAIARVLGYPPDRDPGEFVDDYLRATRRARRVVERVFYA